MGAIGEDKVILTIRLVVKAYATVRCRMIRKRPAVITMVSPFPAATLCTLSCVNLRSLTLSRPCSLFVLVSQCPTIDLKMKRLAHSLNTNLGLRK